MNPEAWVLLSRATLYTTAALLVCLLLRRPLRKLSGAAAAYAIWSCVPLALVAALLPGPSLGITVPGLPALTAMPALSSVHSEGRAWATWLAAAWLGGAVVMAIGLWTRQRRFMRSLGPLYRRDDRLWSAARDAGLPASLGLWGPRIVLPADFSERYNVDERALILAHERMHLRRGDLHANLLAALMLCIGWFNPLMHLAWRAFRLDQELACDAAVLAQHPGKRRSYATAMLKTQLGRDFTPLACHWAASHPLAQRIAALRGSPIAAGRARWRVAMVLLLAATISTAAWALQPARIALASQPALAAGNAVDFATMQPPRYPAAAFDGGIEGFVELQIDIDPGGVPQHIDIVQSRPAGVFDQAVLEAARQWRLKPAYVHGKPIASTVRVPVKFEMDAPEQTSTDAGAARSEAPASNRLAGCASAGCAMQERP
ncbi:TonB family protein [Xanthomonas arboricola]|uniref:TonB family protein n=1 Tax=Xanthomonas arboricola TaxID=56448 RepID=UPI000C833997|nr:TonB family protein [Xanthomonas arboricola]PPU22577.1 energy transducer TonB [Xanthomonas arboricola]SOU04203.1 Antirepressor regulating drug resistance [Xanthomonas arboricola pv. fragariae]